jgi:hypothetical protein
MTLHEYFAAITEEIKRRSDRVRLGFSTHRPSAGDIRENIVAEILRDYLPKAFGVDTGLVLATTGEFSNQADVIVVDHNYNAPLYPIDSKHIWLVESVYALFEVKTSLSPGEIRDALAKCKRFKNLPRHFETVPDLPKIPDSLFVLWAFEAPSPETVKENVVAALRGVPRAEQPDFIVVPDSVLITAGGYREISTVGLPDSLRRQDALSRAGGNLDEAIGDPVQILHLGEHTLLTWLVWLTSWLKAAGHRSAPIGSYLVEGYVYGEGI